MGKGPKGLCLLLSFLPSTRRSTLYHSSDILCKTFNPLNDKRVNKVIFFTLKFPMNFLSTFLIPFIFSFLWGSVVFGEDAIPAYKSIRSHSDCKSSIEQCKSSINFPDANLPAYFSRGAGDLEKVVIVIHGTDRNANEYLHDFISNIHDDNLLSSTAVVAPHFLQVNDSYRETELRWDTGWEHSWKYGFNSQAPIQISSYDVVDKLIKEIDQNWHPKKIIVAGHSAGAQFVQRYAHGSQISHSINSALTFVVSNPSSYLYTRDVRLIDNKWTTPDDCPEFNKYIYGLHERNEYLNRLEEDEIEFNYLQNNLVYLMGSEDVLTDDLDMSCEANAQGINRISRAKNFFQFLNKYFPNHTHRFMTVPHVGHDHIKMFSSKEFVGLLNENTPIEEVNKELTIDRLGAKNSITKSPKRSYFLMGGGEDIDQVFIEYLKALDGGDFLILSAKDDPLDYNDYLVDLANKNSIPLNSVTTVLIHSKRGSQDPRLIKLISESEGIFFSGGDQWKYIERIKDTQAHASILKKLNSGIPFGGTSAGLAILGDVIFTAQNGSVSSDEISNDPHDQRITLTNSLFNIPILKNILTDTHFVVRNRMGRLISFLANAYDAKNIHLQGLGIDEGSALIVNPDGLSRVYGDGSAYLLTPTTTPNLENNQFNWKNIGVHRWPVNTSFSLVDLKIPDYFFNIENGKIISTQENGQVY